MSVCLSICSHICSSEWEDQKIICGSQSSPFQHVGPEDGTQVIRLDSKCPYPLIHFVVPQKTISDCLLWHTNHSRTSEMPTQVTLHGYSLGLCILLGLTCPEITRQDPVLWSSLTLEQDPCPYWSPYPCIYFFLTYKSLGADFIP